MFDQLLSYLNARLTNYDVKRFLRKSTRHAPVRSLDLAQLEDRVMMSAAPLAAALDGGEAAAVQPALEPSVTDQVVADVQQSEQQERRFQYEDGGTTDAGQREEQTKLELVFVDIGAEDYQQLVDDLLASADDRRELEVYLLDSMRDGIEQISEILAGYDDVDAVHLVSHASEGQVKLGNTWLNIDNVDGYAGDIAAWNNSLRDGGDLLIYGCNLAASEDGQALTEALAALCDCDVAASVDDTGDASRGGDWELEFATGSIEAGVAFSSTLQQDWTGLLALATIRDEFSSVAYSNNDGTQPWSDDWQEIGDVGDDPTTGDVRIATQLGEQGLWLKKGNNGASREANLSGATTATLSFDYGRIGLDSSDFVTLEISSNGGGTWAELDRFQGPADDPFLQFTSYDISAYIAGNTQIRFMTNSTMNNADQFIADNIQIEHDGNAPSSTPPTLTMPSGPLNYNISDPLTIIETTPSISDPDSADFDGGSLTVSFTAGATANDRLIIDETGDFSLQGSNVRYTTGGPATTIGTWSGGTDGSTPLVINFNSNATPALAQELVASIGYQNVSATPNVSPRTVEFVVTDGDGGTSNVESETIDIVSTVPELDLDGDDSTASGFDYQTTFSFGAGPVSIVDLDAALFDFDSANLSQIEIIITNNTDKPDEVLTADTTGTNITLNWNASSGRLRLQGNEPIEDYLTVLKTVRYEKTVSSANTDPRIITFVARDTDTNLSATATSTVYIQEATALWLTTEGNVLPGTGTPTLGSWNNTEVIEIADPNLRLETTAPAGTTNGTFSSVRDFGPDMTSLEFLDAIHFVSRDILVGGGSNTFQLEYGDLLFSPDSGTTMGGVVIDKGDLAVFRPLDPDNYSLGGTYSILLDGILASGKKMSGLTLVEQDTLVGDVTLQAGTFLYAYNATGFDKQDIFQFEPTAVGDGTTAGNVYKIIEGLDVDLSKDVNGLELIENTTTIGGTTLQSGWIIVTQGGSDTGVGSGPGGLSHTEFDLFYLDVTTTTKGSGTSNATATLLFDGSDAGIQMTSSPENLTGITLYSSEGAPIDATYALNNPPSITSNLFPGMDENLSVVQTLTANDLDGDPVSFAITGGNDSSLFTINGSNQLVFSTPPDFEAPGDFDGDNIYEVEVTASDGNGGMDVELISVTVNPQNDNNPAFTSSNTLSILENLSIVQTLTATDADLPGQTISFSIAGSGDDDALFSINGSNQLVFNTPPDFEAPADDDGDNVYEVDVTADDGNGGTTLQSISVTVDPVNDNNPVFTTSSTPSINENNSFVITVAATDADLPAQTLSYSIIGGADAGFFSINNSTGDLSFAAPPDFETPLDADTNNIYQVRVQADDGVGGTASQWINVTVNPINDNTPVFTSSSTPVVPENTTAVITVNATDADLPAQTVSYSIVGGTDAGLFTINGTTGDLSFVAPPDFEAPLDADANNVYEVDVAANDGAGGTIVQSISVTVTDAAENMPPTITSGLTPSINENSTIVQTLTASDSDLPAQTITFGITGGDDGGLFFIDGSNQLVFSAAPDYESPADFNSDNVYEVEITANDGNGGTDVELVSVTVNNVNEGPTTSGIADVTVNEDAVNNAIDLTAYFSDAEDATGDLFYFISGNTNPGLFSSFVVDNAADTLTLDYAPDAFGTSDITITARDSGLLTVDSTFTVTVNAVNDPPAITSSNTANVAENTTFVHTVTSTDVDGGLPTYSISGGNDGGLFTINGTTGDLSFLAAPDFELPGDLDTDNVYEVEVTVDDGNLGMGVQLISVTVDAVNDNSPAFTSAAVQSINENSTVVHTITATDDDLPAQTVSFSITGSGADDALFTVNGSNQLVFLSAPDFETPLDAGGDNVYDVNVTASDGNGGSSIQSVSVTISDLSELLVVDTASDILDGDTTSIGALLGSKGLDGFISLREAIEAANNTAGLDTILFNIAGAGLQTIAIDSTGEGVLPTITEAVIIDGYTQPSATANTLTVGNDANLLIELDGTLLGGSGDGLVISGGGAGSTIRGLVINRFGGDGIEINGGGNNTIEGNFIGTNATGTLDRGNGLDGIRIQDSANNTIGGTAPAARNLISGNNIHGVRILGSGSTNNRLEGNYIGTSAAGSAALGNTYNGVWIASGASNNTIGGTTAGAGNVISGNGDTGVEIQDNTTTGNLVQGNLIGTNAAGTGALGNLDGVIIEDAPNNTIGGATTAARNVISGNTGGSQGHGIVIFGDDATGNLVQNNFIGTDITGNADLGNQRDGVVLSDTGDGGVFKGSAASNTIRDNLISGNDDDGISISDGANNNQILGNLIGTNAAGTGVIGNGDDGIQIYDGANTNTIGIAGDGNVIAGSGDRGISIKDPGTDSNTIQGNYIGTDLTGSLNLGNATSGVLILASAADNIVGGPGAGDGNVIAYSGTDGVELWGTAGTGNTIRLNSIFANTELGIDLVGGSEDGFGVTANDGGDGDGGPNSLQNYPVLSAATISGSDITIDGTLNSTPGTVGIVIDFYWSAVADGSSHGEAEQYIGSTTVTTNASGNASFSVPFIGASVPMGSQITATATDPSGNTSEFSLNIAAATTVNTPPTITATSFNVSENTTTVGTVAVSDPDLPPDTITWNITGSGADDTQFTINPGNGALVFNAAPDFESPGDANGDNVYEVEVQVSDGTDTDTQTVLVTVDPVNDNSPSFTTPAAVSVAENTTFVQTVNAGDSDLPAQTVTYSISGGNDALLFTINNATGDLSFLAAPDFEAPADFDSNNIYEVVVTADDNAGNTTPQLISVTVDPVNDNSPAFTTPAALSINENTTFVQTVNATDADLPAQTVTYTISGGNDAVLFTINNATGDLSFLAAPDFEAPADFDSNNIYEVEITADDNAGNTTPQLISVTINPVNDNVPNPAAETITLSEGGTTSVLDNSNLSVLDNDFDADLPGDTLTAVLDSGPSFASSFTLNGDGTFSYTHDGTSNYSDGFSYHVNDGVNNSATIVVSITITPVNNPPALGNNSLTISEGRTVILTPADLSATDADNPAPSLAISVSNVQNGRFELVSAPGVPIFGFIQAQITAGNVQFVHGGGELAPSYDVTVSDGVSSDSGSATIVFSNVNDDPAITSPADSSIVENNSFVMSVTSSDVDGGAPSYAIIGGADGAFFAINAVTGDLSFITPPDFEVAADANSDDVYEVQVQVTDGFAGSDTQLIRVAVTDINEDPLITSAAATVVPENSTAVLSVAAIDPDSDTLTFSISGGADAAHFTIDSATGELIFSSPANFESPADADLDNVYEVSVLADDGKGGMDEQLFLVTVADANDSPSSADDHYTVNNNDTLTAIVPGVLAGDFDEDGDPLAVTLVSGPTHGVLTLNADGSFSYTPSAGYSGNDSFTYQVDDGNGGVDTATVQITINFVGGPSVDPPLDDPPPPTVDTPPETGDPPPPTVDPPPLETRATTPGPAPRERRTFVPSIATGGMLSAGLTVADLQDFGSTYAYQRSVTANRVLREVLTPEAVEALERFMAPFDVGLLANDLQEMVEQLSQDASFAQVMAGSAVGISGAFTVGYVLWTIRGGWLLTSLLAQMPAWRMVDPLVVLSYLDEESAKSADPADEEDDSLESLLDQQNDELPPPDQEIEANSEAFAGQIG